MRGLMTLLVGISVIAMLVAPGCKDDRTTTTTAPGDGRMGAEGAEISNLLTQLRTGTVDARKEAAEKIGDLKLRSQEAVNALGNSLRDSSEEVREASADALVKIQTSDSLRTLRQGAQDMRAKGQAGADDLQEKYNDAIDDLRDDAKDGKQFARDMLRDLGEPLEKPNGGNGINIDIGT